MIPTGFEGRRKSYTVNPPGVRSKLQILWSEGAIYVNQSCGADGLKVDRKGGTTINVRKHGGWRLCWFKALKCAGAKVVPSLDLCRGYTYLASASDL